jgi:hypothetical protein
MTIKKLSAMPYAQAHVEIDDDNNIHLFSYVTKVATITNDSWLTIYGLYSATTRKHIGAFMKEYVIYSNGNHGDYQLAKKIYNDNHRFNIETGEVIEI